MRRPTGKSALAGVMGWPVAHSRSPALHTHWLDRYGLDGAYVPLPVVPDRLENALRGLPALGFRGCNLTLPHKEAALKLVDGVTDRARRIGAVNTVIVREDGGLEGDNTDGFGFLESLRPAGIDIARGPAVIVGAGGAARSILVALLDEGCPEIRLVNRSFERARMLADALSGPVTALPWAERADALAGAGLLVNTTSQGMIGQPALDLALDALPTDALVTDIVYTPLETPLLAAATARGNPAADGLGMLLHQARPGFRAWFGIDPTVDVALRAAVLAA